MTTHTICPACNDVILPRDGVRRVRDVIVHEQCYDRQRLRVSAAQATEAKALPLLDASEPGGAPSCAQVDRVTLGALIEFARTAHDQHARCVVCRAIDDAERALGRRS